MRKNNFGLALQRNRNHVGMARTELARKAGLSRQFVYLVEKGRRDISIGNAEKLAFGLNMSSVNLLKNSQRLTSHKRR